MENYYVDIHKGFLELNRLLEKTNNLESLTIDEFLYFASIHLIDVIEDENFILLLDNLYADLMQNKLDTEYFQNPKLNCEKIKIIINRLERNINNFYGLHSIDKLNNLKINRSVLDEIVNYFTYFIDLLNVYLKNDSNQTATLKFKNPSKKLEDFFYNINDNRINEFLIELKDTFKTEIGVNFKTIFLILQRENLMTLNTSDFKTLHSLLHTFFERDIASYEMFRKTKDIDTTVENSILIKLNPIVTRYKKKA